MSDPQSEKLVGPVLNDREMFEAVIEAAEIDNPGARLVTEDQEGYFRVHAPHELRLTRVSLEEALGRPFRLGEFEPYLSSFGGRMQSGRDDEIVFYLGREEA
jgi:toluene monooxygenase system protein D